MQTFPGSSPLLSCFIGIDTDVRAQRMVESKHRSNYRAWRKFAADKEHPYLTYVIKKIYKIKLWTFGSLFVTNVSIILTNTRYILYLSSMCTVFYQY